MKKMPLTWSDVEGLALEIARQMQQDQWLPDYIVGITRGGLAPAVMLSNYLGVPMHALKVSLRDSADECESNCWMSEDAFGREDDRKKILIVDDINDSGATLNWIRDDWQSSCMPHSETWNRVWGDTVRVAVLIDNASSACWREPDYAAQHINKAETDVWVDFPWECWWR